MALGLLAGYLPFAIPTISVIRDPCFFLKSFQRDADQICLSLAQNPERARQIAIGRFLVATSICRKQSTTFN
jgi:hypothetical protein